jgi:ABC-type multidrug transport system fused ATPase/permease subunit
MLLASDYPFLDVLWTMFIFFLWIVWFWLLFTVFVDVFRRHDIGGGKKTLWLIFVIILPFLGVFIYIITQNDGMTQRNLDRAKAQQAQFDSYVRETAGGGGGGGAATEIANAKQLLDQGAITQAEFDAIKQKALAS